MTLQALLVSTDDSAADTLKGVLAAAGIVVERFSDFSTALDRVRQQRFDALIIDFEDPQSAAAIFDEARKLNSATSPITVALVPSTLRARDLLSGGVHFVLYKPLSAEKASAGLRSVTALLTHERRKSYRIPVQVPVDLTLPGGRKMEGILLDLSETGMDVLTAEPQVPGALLTFRFVLPDGKLEVDAQGQVAWAKTNGQTGVRFAELDNSFKLNLQNWIKGASAMKAPGPEETVPHCKLTDLSLGACYLQTESPFPERSLVDLCLRSGETAVHTEGLVRVVHPGYGMGVEFPSRTLEQRSQVSNLIDVLRHTSDSEPRMDVSPRSLTADLNHFEPRGDPEYEVTDEEMDDPLLDLLRVGTALQQEAFFEALQRQRSGESVRA